MKEQVQLLLELQNIDSRVQEIRASIQALPEKLAPAKQDLAKLEALLQVEKDRLAETETWRKEQEDLIRTEQEALARAKGKLQQAKTTKDYTAASREVENKRRSISEREDEVLKVIEQVEKTREGIEAHEGDVDGLRQQVAAEEEVLGSKIRELEAEANEIAAGRDEIIDKIDPRILKRYEKTLAMRGYAVAPVVDGTCRGCHMAVPPQLNNILARGDSLEACPRCQRILFRQDVFFPDEEAK